MCLSRIERKYSVPDQKVRRGFKVFGVNSAGRYLFPCCPLRGSFCVPDTEWIKATRKREEAGTGERYLTGFHIFVRRKDAESWASLAEVIVPVELRMLRYEGTQAHMKILVADEMKLLKRKPCQPKSPK